MVIVEFGTWLSDYMADQHPPITRPELARRSGVDVTTIGRWIRNEIRPGPEKLRLVAPVLGMEYGDLMTIAGYGAPTDPDPELLTKRPMHPLSVEIDRALDPDSGVPEEQRKWLEMTINQLMEVPRKYMRRRRPA